jgi:hypothetical protein
VTDRKDIPLSETEMALARKGEALVSAAVAEVQAPQSLRERIERDRARAPAPGRAPFWRRHLRSLAAATCAVVAVAAFAAALRTGSDRAEPSIAGVEAVAQLEPTGTAPATLGGSPPVLDAKVGALAFPDWRQSFGWTAVGRRDDELSGRDVTTVFYRNPEGARLGYAVVAGDALAAESAGRRVRRDGNLYKVDREGGQTIVTWTQQGHTCVIVAPAAVPRSGLLDLAASRNA